MTSLELTEIVSQRLTDPTVLGRLACNLRSNDPVEQRHQDGLQFSVKWQDLGSFWRCVISPGGDGSQCLAQIDLHDNATVRIEVSEPCRVTISPEEGFLCLTRYKRS